MATKYPYKASQNALLSIQIKSKVDKGSIDLKMTSNLYDGCLSKSDFDAKRHGRFAAEFIKEHADGSDLEWIEAFIGTLHAELFISKATCHRCLNVYHYKSYISPVDTDTFCDQCHEETGL